jgi:hypothetical protein
MSSSKLLLLSNLEYYQKIKQLFGSSIIAHWPMWEGSGSVAYDISGNGRNGAHLLALIGATLGSVMVTPAHTSTGRMTT